jgi:hypothetical protein
LARYGDALQKYGIQQQGKNSTMSGLSNLGGSVARLRSAWRGNQWPDASDESDLLSQLAQLGSDRSAHAAAAAALESRPAVDAAGDGAGPQRREVPTSRPRRSSTWANALRQIVGAKIAGSAQAERAGAGRPARQGYAKRLRRGHGSGGRADADVAAPGAPSGFVGPPTPGNDSGSVESEAAGAPCLRCSSAGLMSGDPAIRNSVEAGPKMALEDQKLAEGRLTLASEQRAADAETNPQKALALRQLATQYGLNIPEGTPAGTISAILGPVAKKYEEDTKRLQVPKFVPAGQFPGSLDSRTNKYTPYASPDGSPVTDVHETRERKKARAALNIGPDLEPSDDLINKVQAGEADPSSPGMKAPLEKLGKLNSAAAGFADVAQRLKDFLQKHPHGEFAGSDATEAEAIAQDLRALYMENLNMQTLRASDIPILNKVIADPTTLGNIFKSSTGMMDLNRQLDTAVNLAKQRSLSQAGSLGYQPTKTGRYANFQQRTDQTAAAPERKTLGGKTYEKRPDGWYEVTQ